MEKSPEAFRTISEVADWLDVPTHVLRFWESRFAQVKPVKRAGGRRYYRPADMRLIGGIKKLLHEEGMTIRGVQKLLREEGVKHVAAFSQPLGHEDHEADYTEGTIAAVHAPDAAAGPEREPTGYGAEMPAGEAEDEAEDIDDIDEPAPEPAMETTDDDTDEDSVSLPFLNRGAGAPEPDVAVLPSGDASPPEQDGTAALTGEEPAAPAPEHTEDEADAAWSAGADAADSDGEPDVEDAPERPEPERPSAGVPAFGSVRGKAAVQDELPFDTAGRRAREPGEGAPERPAAADQPEHESGGPAPDTPAPAEAAPAPEPEREPEPEPEDEPQPLVSDAPDTDPEDDDAEHAMPHGAVARLVLADRGALRSDPIRIEQVVAALRAVRDRSAS